MTTVMIASLAGTAMALTGAVETPYSTNTALRAGMAIGYVTMLVVVFGPFMRAHWRTIASNRKRGMGLALTVALAASFDYILMSLAAGYIDISTAAVLVDIWPLFIIPAMLYVYRGTGKFGRPGLKTAVAAGTCTAGVVILAGGETGSLGELFQMRDGEWKTLAAGMGLGLAASACIAGVPYFTKWCEDAGEELRRDTGWMGRGMASNLGMMYLLGGMTAASLISTAVVFTAGTVQGEHWTKIEFSALWLVYGIALQSVSSVAWRAGNMLTTRVELNSTLYLIPAFAVLWLVLGGLTEVRSMTMLATGTGMIVAGNLISAKARFGKKKDTKLQAPEPSPAGQIR